MTTFYLHSVLVGDLQQIAVTLQRKVRSGKVIVYTGTIAKSPHVVENNNTRTTQGRHDLHREMLTQHNNFLE